MKVLGINGSARITQRSIRMAGWCSLSALGWKLARRFKAGSSRGIGFVPDASGHFFCVWKKSATVYGNLRIIDV